MKTVILITLLCLSSHVIASDHAAVRLAVAEGKLKPLSEIISMVQSRYEGRIVEVELEHEDDGSYVYDIEVLSPQRKRFELKVDGATGHVIETEGAVSMNGALKPLPDLLKQVLASTPGRVLEVKMIGNRYQLELIGDDGIYRRILIDAISGDIMNTAERASDLPAMIPMHDAITTALAQQKGVVLSSELEREANGRHYFSIRISAGVSGNSRQIKVDANTGEVIR